MPQAIHHSSFRQSQTSRFGALDGARGLLALMVAMYHTIWLSNINQSPLLENGPVLVDLFFVFSGFLMFWLYKDRLHTKRQRLNFIRRRFARIYPLHFTMLMVFVVFQVLRLLSHKFGISTVEPGEILPFQAGSPETFFSFIANLTLTQSMGLLDSLSFNPPAWTVSVEFYTYFVFLGMMMLYPPRKAWHFVMISLGVAALYFGMSRLKPNMNFHYDYGFWRCVAGFNTGVVGAWLYGLWGAGLKPGKANLKFTVLEACTLLVLGSFVIYCPGKLQFAFAPIALLFVWTFAVGKGHISTLMSSRLGLYFGKISYSIYMVHVIFSFGFAFFADKFLLIFFGSDWNSSGLGGDLLFIPYLAVVICVSHWSYHKIEMPGQNVILKLWKLKP